MEQGNVEQTPTVGEPQVNQSQQEVPPVSPKSASPKKPLIVVGILLGFVMFGVGGYTLGMQKRGQGTPTDNSPPAPTQSATPFVQPSPTSAAIIDTSTKLLEPELVSTTGWQVVTFPQSVRVGQDRTITASLELKLPTTWSYETVNVRNGEVVVGTDCNDFNITNEDGNLLLVIKPSCGSSDNDYIPISGQVQKVGLMTNKGNDGHDSHSVRYYDSSMSTYHYGEIAVSQGASVDIQKDQIYPNLILQYEPDRYEQWLWTSYDLTYTGTAANQLTALSTADTIISTLKLTD